MTTPKPVSPVERADSAREVIAWWLGKAYPSGAGQFDLAHDLLTALQSAGYAVVPVEPSKLMISVGEDTLEENTESDWDSGSDGESHNTYTYFRSGHVRAVYRAMLLAARGEPRPTKTEGEG